jgi:hypothetical protein
MSLSKKSLVNVLDRLNDELRELNLKRIFTVFGSGALILLGAAGEGRTTTDLDILDPSVDSELMAAAISISDKLDLNHTWLSGSGDIFSKKLEVGWRNRLRLVYSSTNLEIYSLSKDDLLLLKLYAYFKRGLNTDLDDILSLAKDKTSIENIFRSRTDIFDNKKRVFEILKEIYGFLK